MRKCIFCEIDISHLPPKAKYCCSDHRVYHYRGIVFGGDTSPKKKGRKPKAESELSGKPKSVKATKVDYAKIVSELMGIAGVNSHDALFDFVRNASAPVLTFHPCPPIVKEVQNKPDLAHKPTEAIPEPSKEENKTVLGLGADYKSHPAYPFDFDNDGPFLIVEKYTQYPLSKRPADQKAKKEYDKLKKESDNLIREAWADFKKSKK